MIHLTEKDIKNAGFDLSGLVWDYRNEIDRAYGNIEDDSPLSVSLGLKFGPGKQGIKIVSNIGFAMGKIKDKRERDPAEEKQMPIFSGSDGQNFQELKRRAILFRDFSAIRRRIAAISMPWPPASRAIDFDVMPDSYRNPILFKRF